MKIGTVDYKNGIFLAPMAGITDSSFRLLCAEQGAEGVCTEMISAKAIIYKNKKTRLLAFMREGEGNTAIQIFGSEPEIMAEASSELMEFSPSSIDINMGCPMPKIAGNGEGSELMRNPALCGRIVKAVSESVNVPVTVKIRLGTDEKCKNAAEVAAKCEENGAAAVFVHGRFASQKYSGRADYSGIAEVKRTVSVPCVANGDILTGQQAVFVREATGCDGVMIGRGSFGRPWVFAEMKAAFECGSYNEPAKEEKLALLLRHIELVYEEKGEHGIIEMRKHMYHYTKGVQGSAHIRSRINAMSSLEHARCIARSIFC